MTFDEALEAVTARVHNITVEIFDEYERHTFKVVTCARRVNLGFGAFVRLIGLDGELHAGVGLHEVLSRDDAAVAALIHERMMGGGLKPHGAGVL